MSNLTDRAWAAGFFDGEGCLGLYKGRGASGVTTYVPRLVVSGTNREVLDHLVTLIGGKVAEKSHQHEGWAQGYQLQIHAAAAIREALERMLPFLMLKRAEAEILLDFCISVTSKPSSKAKLTGEVIAYREGVVVQLHNLKGTSGKRGRIAA